MSKVTVWIMSEEERLSYIKKHPIAPVELSKRKGSSFANIYDETNKKRTKDI